MVLLVCRTVSPAWAEVLVVAVPFLTNSVEFTANTGADTTWISLDIMAGGDDTVVVDLSPLNGTAPYAIAYAWDNQKDTCCNAGGDSAISNGFIQCTPGACPIHLARMVL